MTDTTRQHDEGATMGQVSYEQDFYTWTQQQAAALRAGRVEALDIEHLAEEIESMGRSERWQLLHRLEVLLMHLLKWGYQPDRRSRSWHNTVRVQRFDLHRLLAANPGLRPQLPVLYADGYWKARLLASMETGLDEERFPQQCPFTLEQALDDEFWPDAGDGPV